MKLLQCVSLLLCLHFIKIRGVKPNILKTSGNQENKYVLNTGENETNDREKETEITSNKDDVVHEVYNIPVKNSLKRNNELYNLKNNFGIKHLNNKNRLVDKTLMNARKQNSEAKTDKKRKDNGKIILNNLNPSRRNVRIDPVLNSILDSLLLDNDGHVTHFDYHDPSSVERRKEEFNNYYHRVRQWGREKRREGKRIREREKQKLKKEKKKWRQIKKKLNQYEHRIYGHLYEHSRGTITIDGKKTSLHDIEHTESHQGTGKPVVKMSDYLQDAKGTLLGDITINGKTFSLDDISNMNVMVEI